MKDKIIAALRSKYSSKYALSDKALAGIAAMLGATVTEEGQIDAAISTEGVVELLTGVQSYGDERANKAKQPDSANPKPGDPVQPVPAAPAAPANETPTEKLMRESLEKIMQGMTILSDKVNSMEGGKVIETRKQVLEGKLKDAPEALKKSILDTFEYMNFADDAAFTGYLDKITPQIDAAKLQTKETEIVKIGTPIHAIGGKEGTSFAQSMQALNATPAAAAPAATA